MTAIGLVRELGRLGAIVGSYPAVAVILGLSLSVPGLLGFLKFKLDAEMNGGFVSSSAPSHREIADQQSFFEVSGVAWYMALFGKTDGNLLNDNVYNELNSFYERTMEMNLTVDGKDFYQFQELCHPFCGINLQLQKLMEVQWFAYMMYPVSKALGYDVNIGKHIFERSTTNGSLTGAKMMVFYYTSLIKDEKSKLQLETFERRVSEMAKEHNRNNSKLVHLRIHGTNTAGHEIRRGLKDTMKLIIGSVSLVSLLFLILLVFSSWMRAGLTYKRIFFCLTSLVLPPLALASGCGLICIVTQINVLYVMAPVGTLVLIAHVQNVLHLVEKFDGLKLDSKKKQYSRSEMMGATFEQIAPTNTIINLWVIVGFGAARFFLPLSYADYSLGVASSLLVLWILELLVLGGLLAFECEEAGKYYEKSKAPKRPKCNPSANCNKFLIRPYSLVICSIPGRLVGILLLLAFIGFPYRLGIKNLHSNMDFRRFFPNDSDASKGFDIMDSIWKDFHQILFIINNPPNFSDYGEYMEFRKFISDIEAIPNVLNNSNHMSWIFDYFSSELNMSFFSEKAAVQVPNMTKFHSFITTFPYEAWNDGIKFEYLDTEKTQPKINKMVAIAAFHNILGLEGKKNVINLCRQVALKNPSLSISAFDTDSRTADVIDNIMPTLFKWSLILTIATAAIPLASLWNFAASFLCLVGCSFLLVSSYAFVGLLDLPLDLFSMTVLVTVSAIGIRISLHFIGEFLLVWVHDDRTMCALQNSSTIVLQTTLLALLNVCGLLFLSTVPLFSQYALMTTLVLASSIFVSFFVLPLIADFLPTQMISFETCY